jgi:hypothetical protein
VEERNGCSSFRERPIFGYAGLAVTGLLIKNRVLQPGMMIVHHLPAIKHYICPPE